MLHHPEERVLASGGQIFFALDSDGSAVGTVALRHEGARIYELTKMAVNPSQRGTGVGRLLMNAVLEAFQCLGGTEPYLEPNTRLGPALALYESARLRTPTRPPPWLRLRPGRRLHGLESIVA